MSNKLNDIMSDTLEIIALMDIFYYVLNSQYDDVVDNLQLATFAKIILGKLQELKNNIDFELIKNAAS